MRKVRERKSRARTNSYSGAAVDYPKVQERALSVQTFTVDGKRRNYSAPVGRLVRFLEVPRKRIRNSETVRSCKSVTLQHGKHGADLVVFASFALCIPEDDWHRTHTLTI
jgi:hypothetical protein